MPRREQPLESGDEVLLGFAQDLRNLREKAGSPTYRQLSAKAHYSAAALSEAAGGRKLPTLAVTLAYVRACDGDRAAWEARWREAATDIAATHTVESDRNVSERAPYVGAATFDVADADRLRGRDKPLEHLLRQMCDHRFIAVFGASGCGKSSFLRAGLVAKLTGDGHPVVIFTPGSNPIEECAVHLAAAVGRSPAELHTELAAAPSNLHLHIRQALADRPGAELTLVVDQFEEVFSGAARDWLIDALTGAACAETSRTKVVLGVRADARDRCEQHPKLAAAHPVPLAPMSPDELRQAITEPAVHAGYRVETALVSELIAVCANQPGALPLVSQALLETWRRRRGATLTLSGYQATGGIPDTLARTAEKTHGAMDESQQEAARQIFLRLTELGDRTEDTARRVDRAELNTGNPDTPIVLDRFAKARVITLGRDTVELTHDSLIHTWPRLRDWLTEDRAALRAQRKVTKATENWESLDRDPGVLYRGTHLELANKLTTLTPHEREFVNASRSAVRRQVRRTRRLVAMFVAIVLIAATVISAAVIAAHKANDTALAEQLLRDAAGLRTSNPALALQLSLAAYRLHPGPATRGSLYELMATPYAARITGQAGGVTDLDVNRKGDRIVITGPSGTTLLSIDDPNNPSVLAPISGSATSVRFSPDRELLAVDGQLFDIHLQTQPKYLGSLGDHITSAAFGPGGLLATISSDQLIRLWDITDPANPRQVGSPFGGGEPGALGASASVTFSPDGFTLAATTQDYEIQLWDLTTPERPKSGFLLRGHTDAVLAMVFSHRGNLLATASQDATARLWNVTGPGAAEPIVPLNGQEGAVRTVAFSPADDTLATAGRDHVIRLWDLTTGAPHMFATLTGHSADVHTMTFANGHTLATGSADQTVRLTDIAQLELARSTEPIRDVTFSPDGHTIATASDDRFLRFWDLTNRNFPQPGDVRAFENEMARVMPETDGDVLARSRRGTLWWGRQNDRPTRIQSGAVAVSPDHHLLVTENALLDVHDPSLPVSLATFDRNIGSAVFSQDNHLLAATDRDGRFRLWDITDRRHPRERGNVADAGVPVAFSRDSRLLAVVNADGTTRLWDVTHPERAKQVGLVPSGIKERPETKVMFSPNGRMLATAGDAAAQLWDITTPRAPTEVATLRGHTDQVSAVTFSPDGSMVATAGDDHMVRLWETDVEKVAARICGAAYPRISPEEWQRYLPGQSYRPPCP